MFGGHAAGQCVALPAQNMIIDERIAELQALKAELQDA